jgi:glycosyltransferase involved in cell wall biosynthesis
MQRIPLKVSRATRVSCLVITSNATLGIGGEGIFAKELALELENYGINSTFLMRNELKGAELTRDLECAGSRLPYIRKSILLVFNLIMFSISAIPLALKFIKEERNKKQIIVIHVHDGTFAGVVGVITSQLSGVPLVLTFHGTHILSAFYIFDRLKYIARIVATGLTRFCTNNARNLIAVDAKTKKIVEKETKTNKNIEIVPTFCRNLGSSIQIINKNILKLPTNSILVGYIGRLSPEKNVMNLVRAFREISNSISSSYLIIVGDGASRKDIENYSKDHGIQDRVILLGYVLDIESVFSRLNCIVLPSKSEGFPLVIFEAWSLGIPVIASNVIPNLKNEVNALTFPPEDIDKLKKALIEILSNGDLVNKITENGKRQCSYSREDVTKKYLSIYLGIDSKIS